MTIIIALKDEENKRIILGADKQSSCGQIIYKSSGKIISVPIQIEDEYGKKLRKTEINMGLCGYAFLKSFFQHGFDIPNKEKNENFIEYLYKKFFPQFREALNNNQLVRVKDGMLNTESGMIFVFEGEIYLIGSNLCVDILNNEFYVDGSGWEVATGSLYTNLNFHKEMDKKEIVEQAIISAGENTIYCDTDVQIKEINY